MFYFICFSFFIACSNDIEEVKAVSETFVSIEEGTGVAIKYTEDGIPTILIEADSAVRYNLLPPDIPYTDFPKGLKLTVYDENGNVDSELNAMQGNMSDNSDHLEVNGDVQIINQKGEQLETETLIWDQKNKKIVSEGFVKIFTDDEIIYGTGFEADENFTNYVIYNIEGIVKVRNNEL